MSKRQISTPHTVDPSGYRVQYSPVGSHKRHHGCTKGEEQISRQHHHPHRQFPRPTTVTEHNKQRGRGKNYIPCLSTTSSTQSPSPPRNRTSSPPPSRTSTASSSRRRRSSSTFASPTSRSRSSTSPASAQVFPCSPLRLQANLRPLPALNPPGSRKLTPRPHLETRLPHHRHRARRALAHDG